MPLTPLAPADAATISSLAPARRLPAANARPIRGAVLLASGLLMFSCMDATTKYLASFYDVPLIVAIRYVLNFLMLATILGPTHGRLFLPTARRGLVVVRALCLAAASMLVGLALQRMPVAETTAITFLGPIMVVLIAGPLLGERVHPAAWWATALGFGGVALVVRPGRGLDPWGTVFALSAVGINAAYQLLSRSLAVTERTIALLFYSALTGAVCFGLTIPWLLRTATHQPSLAIVALFLSLGVTGGLGQFLFTSAYRHAPASTLAPLNYIQLIWAALLGWLIFRQLPSAVSLLGMTMIVGAGVTVGVATRRSRPSKREQAIVAVEYA